jgi:hypothetical protein
VRKPKRLLLAGCAAAALTAGAAGMAVPASAGASPVVTGGLVNITVTTVLNTNQVNVQVPIGVAANVCGVAANVLAQQTTTGPVACTSATTQTLPVAFR